MKDQAESLRRKMLAAQDQLARSLAVVSGKGGVGKSNFSTNFSYALVQQEKKVVIVDMDLGMGNVHILLGHTPKFSLMDYLVGTEDIESIINKMPEGLHFISGGSGLSDVVEWTDEMFERLTEAFHYLQTAYDFVIFDMGAGANQTTIELILAIDEVIVITTGEPTSITDAYSMMKYIALRDSDTSFYLVGNRIHKGLAKNESVSRLQFAMKKFLQVDAKVLGELPEDPVVQKSVIQQKPYLLAYPNAPISKRIKMMTEVFTQYKLVEEPIKENRFMQKLRSIFVKGRE